MSNRLNNTMVMLACLVAWCVTIGVAGRGDGTADWPDAIPVAAKVAGYIYLLLESIPAMAILWLGAAGYGYPIRRWLLRDLPYAPIAQVGSGMAVLLLLNWLVAWAGLLMPVVSWTLPAVGAALLGLQIYLKTNGVQPSLPTNRRWPWSLVLVMPGAAILLLAAACPPGTLWRVEAFGYDVLSYHLQIPREWVEAGGMIPLPHNVYGYLPGLLEATYAHLGTMRGSVTGAIYTCQFFHASLALFAAAAIGCAVAQLTTAVAGGVAAAVLLSLPWTIITGSLAYNEMAVVALGATAVLVLLDIRSERPGAAAVIGLLVGAATLAKPTAGPMLAVPIGLVLLTRLNHAIRWRQPPVLRKAMLAALTAAVVGTAALSPWLIRNAVWTGNPVFPFATSLLGTGHWDDQVAQRWDRGHGLSWHHENRIEALSRQWLFNAGYGAAGGEPTPRETRNIARFGREYGWPVLWGAMLLAALITVPRLRLRRAVGAMLLILALQLGFWLVATHLQSRFLITTLLPACIIIGLGIGNGQRALGYRLRWMMPVASCALVGSLVATSLSVLWMQTQVVRIGDQPLPAPPLLMVDALDLVEQTAMDDLPMASQVYLVADNSSLLYIDPPIDYHSAFDNNPLGDIIREHGSDPAAVTAALRRRGNTHVWIHWAELDRLHSTYGYDPQVTAAALHHLADAWRIVKQQPGVFSLYRLE